MLTSNVECTKRTLATEQEKKLFIERTEKGHNKKERETKITKHECKANQNTVNRCAHLFIQSE